MKSIFITGAGSGIGLATAQLFVRQGWRVGLADRQGAAVEALAVELGPSAEAFEVDVIDPQAVQHALAGFCRGPSGPLQALFNSAGIVEMQLFAQTPLARLHQIVAVNLNGVINCIHAALPHLAAARGAQVVTMGSAAGIHGIPEEAVYSATKFAVRGLTEALNIELAAQDIWVSDVMVTYVRTPMVQQAPRQAKSVELLGYSAGPEDVATLVWQAVHEQAVHWFLGGADSMLETIEGLPLAKRGPLIASMTGF